MHTNDIISSFFFVVKIATTLVRDMLENFAVPQIPLDFLFQQDSTPPHYHGDIPTFLSRLFQGGCIVRESPIAWLLRSSNLTPLDIFCLEIH
ncbi:hypothetical protein TNCV_91541 [Trichonephila clavipes]|nr:hypothetical protein TNCV_91541 [Trichonephila clavipes]